MEKYKLKKDTFFYKTGTICKLTPRGNMVLDNCKGTCILHNYQLKNHPELLNEWFKKVEEKKYGGRVPKEGDAYLYVSASGVIIEGIWDADNYDRGAFESNSAFWTREEAEKELKRRKAYVVLKEDTEGFKPRADLVGDCYAVYYSLYGNRFYVEHQGAHTMRGNLCFATFMDAQNSIKTHRQQWLDYLGIEEEK